MPHNRPLHLPKKIWMVDLTVEPDYGLMVVGKQTNYNREQKMIDRAEKLQASIRICEFLLDNPDFPIPGDLRGWMGTYTHYVYGDDDEQKIELIRLTRMLGSVDKVTPSERQFGVERDFGGMKLRVVADREATCNKKVVGTKMVTREVIKVPAVYETVEEEVEEVEWECPGSLLKP